MVNKKSNVSTISYNNNNNNCKGTIWSTTQKWFGQWPNKPTTIDLLESGLDTECLMS